jgi:hypothetical protein
VVKHSRLATSLTGTTSLAEAEDIARTVCGFSEIDDERAKAGRAAATDRTSFRSPMQDRAIRTFEEVTALRRQAQLGPPRQHQSTLKSVEPPERLFGFQRGVM